MATAAQLKNAIAKAKAANRPDAVADLESRLAALGADNYIKDDGTAWMSDWNATNEVSGPLHATTIGAGRTVDKLVTGVSDLFAGDEEQARTAADQQANDLAYANLQDKHPVATTAGEIAPYLATAMIPGGMAVQTAAGGTIGAAMYNTPEDRLKQGAIDAGLSALPYATGKLFNKVRGGRLANRADDLGWKLTPGEALDSAGLRSLEASMESFPPTAGPMRRLKEPRQGAMNRVALEAIGETGADFSDDALLAARARVGEVFDNTIKSKSYGVDDGFLDALGNIETAAKQGVLGGGDTAKIVDNILTQAGDGAVNGNTLQQWRTTLQTAASKAYRSDTATKEYADALDDMVSAIDGLIGRNLSGDELKAWQQARGQWTAIKQLEKSKAITETGDVSGRKLANNLSANDMHGYYRGANKSDLYDAARLSKAYPPMADSGTASRMSVPAMMGMTLTSPLSVPAFGAANLAARAYANPAAASKLSAAGLRGYYGPGLSEEEIANLRQQDHQRELAELLRSSR
ncbi:hypothetical protein EYC87_05295 [Halieaceae bacterium IMCC8485]|uniref:Uncharacterized protein n=1 Tax=Candidatus Seongchinamella marina TaxID=2518990 RepID=A0ABT3SSM7_9GAMM|nr:hypothetical protein [Candidatus Seongchinamella marina]MCX2972999.1 hypothetical protein [Candidatus Seongchinamella marina]